MQDYRLILTLDGQTGRYDLEMTAFPNTMSTEEDYNAGIQLLKYGDTWLRQCLAELKIQNKQIQTEIDTMLKSNMNTEKE